MNIFEIAARTPLLVASLLLPGWLMLHASRLPRSPAAAFALSVAVIYFVSLGFGLTGFKLSLPLIGLSLLVICAGLALLARPAQRPLSSVPAAPPWDRASRWMLGFIVASIALFVWRAFAQPLSGPDTSFRWNYLALEIVRTGDFSYYPPVTLADFERYFYADGFAPFVAIQYWWSYAVLGTTMPHVTGFVVTAQFVATLSLAAEVVAHTAGRTAGFAAAAVIASSGLIFWTFLLGQETGWIALALVAALWCWTRIRSDSSALAPLAVAFAILPALVAREYGPIFLGAGVLLALQTGAQWRTIALFAGAGALLAAPWYLHVWVRCGNPFYSLSPFGLFPTNETLSGLLQSCRERMAIPRQRPGLLAYRAADLAVNSPLILVATCWALAGWRRYWATLAVAGLVAALWFSAASYTSGGLHIANRVLAPGLVMLVIVAVWVRPQAPGGRGLARLTPVILALAAVWGLYVNAVPPAGPAPLPLQQWWEQARDVAAVAKVHPSRISPGSLALHERIASDNAYFHAEEHAAGFAHPIVPFWADELRFLFSTTLTADDAVRQLRALNIGAIQIQRAASPNWPYWVTRPFFHTIVATWPLVENVSGLELHRVPPVP